MREHIHAFEYLGGVTRTCLYDNMKVVVLRHGDEGPLYNPKFLAFATHYGYTPWACRVRRSQTKGKVERHFDYVEKNLLNGRTFTSLEHLNEVTTRWLADVRIHRETQQRPIDRHAEERPHLIPLPATPYEVAPVEYRVVNVEGFIVYQQNSYSVPWRYIGQALPVRVTESELIVYGSQVKDLATGAFIQRLDNLVMVGQSGVGKSYLIQAIGESACVLGYSVRYTTSAALLSDLTKSLADQTLPQRVRYYARFDLLVIDEFAFDRIERTESPQAANLLYKIIDARSRQRSTALVTNIDFDAWGEYLGDPPLAMAFLDRVVDGAIIMKINGKSYRAHRGRLPQANPAPQK
ncbi:MAG: ATP-binding protein [Planctomycetes bacterium]|nr:ATP-binding protein [Planctomycetota bacterium]